MEISWIPRQDRDVTEREHAGEYSGRAGQVSLLHRIGTFAISLADREGRVDGFQSCATDLLGYDAATLKEHAHHGPPPRR